MFTVGRDSGALSVSDQGPGFPTDFDAQRSVNTGLELVDSLARWDLAGQIDFENSREGGACVRVTIPLQTVPDSHAVEGKTASII